MMLLVFMKKLSCSACLLIEAACLLIMLVSWKEETDRESE